jgi:hypothetical protein
LASSGKKKLGELAIHVTNFKPETSEMMLGAILSANSTCPGLPKIVRATRGPFVAGGGAGPGPLSAAYFVEAEWTHSTLGPIKEQVRACLMRQLQTVDPGIGVTAERLT